MSIRRSVTAIVIAALVGKLALFADARGASGQITFVQQLGQVNEESSIAVISTQAPAAAGNSIVVALRGLVGTSAGLLQFQCSDPVNGIYRADVSRHSAGVLAICSIHNIAPLPAGSAITVQVLGSRRVSAAAYKFAGLSPTGTLAVAASGRSLPQATKVFTESINVNLTGDFLIFGTVSNVASQGQAPQMQPYSKNCPSPQPLTVLPALFTGGAEHPAASFNHAMYCMTSSPNVASYQFGALFTENFVRMAVVAFYRGSGGLGAPTPKEPGSEDPEAPDGAGSTDDDGILNASENFLDNVNLNTNGNENANTQDQSNEQEQSNNNNQVTTVDSSPSVVIDFD